MKGEKVYFTEDNWATQYEGVVKDSTLHTYFVESRKYGNRWIPKSDVKLKDAKNTNSVGKDGIPFRLELGEAWMWCSDCMSKLYSFDGVVDTARKCPHPSKCANDRNRLRKNQ